MSPDGGASSRISSPDDDRVPASIKDSAAWKYARAYQEGDWERVMAMTPWVQERLAFAQQSGGPEAAATEKSLLLETLGARTVAENRLQKTGVEDAYVFTPGAEIAFDSVDDGREDLEAPVVRRTWLIVTYPVREKSLLDSENVPIRSLRVGVNVSQVGLVLKANVIGNLDVDWESVSYDWPTR